MKNKTQDKSDAYRNIGLGRIVAPTPPKDQPKSSVIKSNTDLRGGRK